MSRTYDVYSRKQYSELGAHPIFTPCQHALPIRIQQYMSGVCGKLRACCTSLCCESAVVTMTLVSVLAISGEMLIDFGVLTAPSSEAEQQQQSPSSATDDTLDSSDTLSGGGRGKEMEVVQTVFHYTSLAIAVIFFLEIALKLLVFRRKFLVWVWQVLDMLVVVAAVVVEVTFEVRGRTPELEACTYIIIFRLWRLPHACNIQTLPGRAVKAKALRHDMEQDLEVWKAGKSKMEEKWRSLQARYHKQKDKIEQLEQELLILERQKKVSQRQSPTKSFDTCSGMYDGTVVNATAWRFSSKNHLAENHISRYEPRCITSFWEETEKEKTARKTERQEEEGRQRKEDRKTGGRGKTKEGRQKDRRKREDKGRKTERQEEEGRQRKEDRTAENDQQNGSTRNSVHSVSESSVSCQHQEHEVHVQIEPQDNVKVVIPPHESGDRDVHTAPQPRHDGLTKESDCSYENEGFICDEDWRHTEDLEEEGGSRTYTSADGIPMTDL